MYKKYATPYNNGTAALCGALKQLQSKNVIIPTYTCEDILTAVIKTGCLPIIVDCNENLQIDPKQVEKWSSSADTIIVPHMFGIQVPIEPLLKFNLKIIEDVSQCHGLPGLGKHADVVVSSVNKSKWIDCGGGGIMWSDEKQVWDSLPAYLQQLWDNIPIAYKIRANKAQELIDADLPLIGKDLPNSWLRAMYFTNLASPRRPYKPLHEIYGDFKCPIVDSYSNNINWISIFA